MDYLILSFCLVLNLLNLGLIIVYLNLFQKLKHCLQNPVFNHKFDFVILV